MKSEIYTCDECGAQKKEANNWFIVSCRFDGHVQSVEVGKSVLIAHWGPVPNVNHLCGQACALTFVAKFMFKGTSQ